MKLIIKEAGSGEADIIRRVGTLSYKEHFTEIWTNEGIETYLTSQFSSEKLSSDFTNNSTRYFISYFDNLPIGLLKVNLHKILPNSSKDYGLELEKIYLLKEFAGKGLGEILLQFVREFAIKNSEEIIWLDVLKTNTKAKSFYERYGFVVVGQLDFSTDKVKPDMWVMKCDLSRKS